jgi:putative DNA primase/helicase
VKPTKKYTKEQLDQYKREINAIPIVASRIPGNREGDEFVCSCPFRAEKTPSFKVYKNDEGVWLFKCFGCGETGNVFQFVERIDHISFPEAVAKVLEQAGTIDPAEVEAKPKSKKLVTFSIAQYAQCERALETSPAGQKWITDRGITMETARRFHLGFVQDATAVCGTDHPWRKDGWITFPTLSDSGQRVFAIKYRSIVAKHEDVNGKAVSGVFRAKNTPTILFNIREVNALVETDMATGQITKNELDDVFIAEGEPDTLVLSQTGTPAVGLPSALYALNSDACTVLKRAKRIFIAAHSDAPGQKAATRLWKQLGANTYVVHWPDGVKDANEMLMKECAGMPTIFTAMIDDLKTEAIERGEWTEPRPEPEPKKDSKKESAASASVAEVIERYAAQVKTRKIKWLWPDRVGSNKITVYAGNPDNGKSLAAADLVAHVTAGTNFPDCANPLPPSEAMMIIGEDDDDDTTVPRLMSAGADLNKVHLPAGIVRPNDTDTEIRLDIDREALELYLEKHPAIRLLVIDPISSFLGDVNMIAEQSVRSVLTPLKNIAARRNVAILFVMHLNKKNELDAIARVGGAMAFTGVARSVWLFIRDASSEEREVKDSFRMCKMKGNLTPAKSGGLAYTVQARQVMTHEDGETFAPYIVWGEKINQSADESLGRTGNKPARGRPEGASPDLQRAIGWLQDALQDGEPHPSKELKKNANEEANISWPTLRRAQQSLGIKPYQKKGGPVGNWVWQLPQMNATAAAIEAAEPQGERADVDAAPTPAEGEPEAAVDRGFELK